MKIVPPSPATLSRGRRAVRDAAHVSLERLGIPPMPTETAESRERLALIRRIIYPGRR